MNLLFILNPKAGKGKAASVMEVLKVKIPKEISYAINTFTHTNEFEEIIDSLSTKSYTHVVAVGGDGTVNYIAKHLINTSMILGILPLGSGNGLARSLGISMNLENALDQILLNKNTEIDYGTVNGLPFFCTSGIGFDAQVGYLFAESKSRGLSGYVKIIARQFFKYKPQNYALKLNNQSVAKSAFLITVANAGQYGNDFYIAPEAKLNDGKFHVAIVSPLSFLKSISLFFKILQKKASQSKYVETFISDELTVTRNEAGPVHFDGEPLWLENEITFKCISRGLKVVIGERFNVL